MKRAKYLFTFFIGTLTYVVLSITIGQNSVRCGKFIEDQQKIIINQVAVLESINSELTMEVNALKNDNAVIAAYARKLDYVSEGEKLVKITGLKRSQPPLYDAGTVIKHKEPVFMSEIACKCISLLFGLLTFIIIFLYDLHKGNINFKKTAEPIVTGIPVYDLQQI